MRCVYLLASILAVAVGSLRASSTLACSGLTGFSGLGTIGSNGCFTTDFATVTALDSLNWGAPISTSGESGLGPATQGNSFALGFNDPVQSRTATASGYQVQIQLPSGSTPTAVTRMDDFALLYNGSTWLPPDSSSPVGFAGHFGSASGSSPTPDGDSLVALPSGGPLELSFLNPPDPVLGIWFRISALGSASDISFAATVQAFDAGGHPLGTYTLGKETPGTGGQCSTLGSTPPVPCDDAPYVGFYDPEGRISSIYISATVGGSPVGFAIDSLYMDEEVPEPAVPLMIAGGLAAMALYRRKRGARVS